jgi:hypothetical protein
MIVISLAARPMLASAQDTTIDYQGYVMGGTSTTYIYPGPIPPPNTPSSQILSPPVSTIAAFNASVTYSGSVAQNDLVVDSYQINLTANNGQNFQLLDIGPGLYPTGSQCPGIGGQQGCLSLTTSGDAVTGATINLNYLGAGGHTTFFDVSIGPSGDAFSETAWAAVAYGCSTGGYDGIFTYVGPNSALPCTMNVSNPTAGIWTTVPPTPVPEIDPTSAASGLTLLLGSVLVLRGRRVRI